jgi:phosphonate transport system permease protein
VRAAVIVGAVGGGGLGVELLGTINEFDFRRTLTLILMLIALIALLDQAARYIKKYPVLVAIAIPAMAVALRYNWPSMVAFRHSVEVYGKMLPPTLPGDELKHVPLLVLQTLEIAFGGTFFALIGALPLALCGARNLAPAWLSIPARRLLEALRSVPEMVWGLILVTASILGPPAGVAALALHCTGSLGRLFAESFENIPAEPVHAISATGASRLSTALFAFLPMALPTLAVHTLFRLEWNVRAATVVGIIGAGGVGESLFHAMQLFFYKQMMAYILITGLMVATVDFLSSRSRKALGLGEVYA